MNNDKNVYSVPPTKLVLVLDFWNIVHKLDFFFSLSLSLLFGLAAALWAT